ncbi:hypothetical protein LMG22931_06078 [Paraburkholderia nemoris]|nr:hypothetical protein LMG22931_06078 [Paraburkholderia nemoris]
MPCRLLTQRHAIVRHKRKRTNPRIRRTRRLIENRRIVRKQTLHRRRIKHIARKIERQINTARALRRIQTQIELRGIDIQRHAFDLESGQRCTMRRMLPQIEHHVEKRRTAGLAHRLQRLDQSGEWKVLIALPFGKPCRHLVEQPGVGIARAQRCAHHNRVDEETDQAGRVGAMPARDRHTHAHVARAGVAMQQHVEGGQQRGEQRGAACAREMFQRIRRRGRHASRPRTGSRAGRCIARARPATVERQRKRFHVDRCELRAPVIELLSQRLIVEPFALPTRVIGVLNAQRLQFRTRFERTRLAISRRHRSFVERQELSKQHTNRPAIGHDVMHRNQQTLFVAFRSHQIDTQQRSVFEIEGPPCELVQHGFNG